MENKKEVILVVEDEDIARKNLEHILIKTGYEVISVNNGSKAIELLHSKHFDLVITDLKMEKVDGMQVLHKTKALQPYTEVIIITGYATIETSVQACMTVHTIILPNPIKSEMCARLPKRHF